MHLPQRILLRHAHPDTQPRTQPNPHHRDSQRTGHPAHPDSPCPVQISHNKAHAFFATCQPTRNQPTSGRYLRTLATLPIDLMHQAVH